MKVVIQRVREASVTINGNEKSGIGVGLLVLLGIEDEDAHEDADWLVRKIINMRIFQDADDKMNLNLKDVRGDLLIISQFTLHASTKKGNRPSFIKAARPEVAIPLYEYFIAQCQVNHDTVHTGEFGADMKVSLLNDGPVTIVMDTKNKY